MFDLSSYLIKSEKKDTVAQIYARALVHYRNPNRFFNDLDIINDSLYGLKTSVINIIQDSKLIEVILIGYSEKFTHFCDVFITEDNQIINQESWDGISNLNYDFDNINKFIMTNLDQSKEFQVLNN
jgi:hypothetical protein